MDLSFRSGRAAAGPGVRAPAALVRQALRAEAFPAAESARTRRIRSLRQRPRPAGSSSRLDYLVKVANSALEHGNHLAENVLFECVGGLMRLVSVLVDVLLVQQQ